jgi:carboxy-terminal domain RNA polymerase II polypeptide A small phosphatase
MKTNKLLILDIDETLVFATPTPLDREPDFRVFEYSVYQRPGLEDFLEFAFKEFSVGIWTSSGEHYAREVAAKMIRPSQKLALFWWSSRCTRRRNLETDELYWVKDLKKVKRLGYRLEHVIVVDDSPEKLERSYGNHIQIEPYAGDTTDHELSMLSFYLRTLKQVTNVREIDKRRWRERANHKEI